MQYQPKPKKPFALLYDEAGDKIFNAVSEAAEDVPFFLLEGILCNLLHQVREKANTEKVNAEFTYKKQIEEYNKAEAEKERGEHGS